MSSLPPRSTVIIDRQPSDSAEVPHLSPFIELKPDVEPDVGVESDSVPPRESQSVAESQAVLPPEYHVAPRGVASPEPASPESTENQGEQETAQVATAPTLQTPEVELPAIGSEEFRVFSAEPEAIPTLNEEEVVTLEEGSPPEKPAPENPVESGPEVAREVESGTESEAAVASEVVPDTAPEMVPEASQIVILEDLGNFPFSEPEIAPVNKHFGVKKPVILPDVPKEKVNPEDLLILDGVSELPEHPKPPEPHEPHELLQIESSELLEPRNFPPVE